MKIAIIIFIGLLSFNLFATEKVCTNLESGAISTVTLEDDLVTSISIASSNNAETRKFTAEPCIDLLKYVIDILSGNNLDEYPREMLALAYMIGQSGEFPEAVTACGGQLIAMVYEDKVSLYSEAGSGDYTCQ